jgi:hypothetical protein
LQILLCTQSTFKYCTDGFASALIAIASAEPMDQANSEMATIDNNFQRAIDASFSWNGMKSLNSMVRFVYFWKELKIRPDV